MRAALHLALTALNVGDGDSIITTAFTFAATANVIVHRRAFPVFVDIDPDTYNLDASRLQLFLERPAHAANQSLVVKRNGRRARAVIPVHCGGHPCDMGPIKNLATRFELTVIEDAANAVGAQYIALAMWVLGKDGLLQLLCEEEPDCPPHAIG